PFYDASVILFRFSLHAPATTAIYTLSLHDALPIWRAASTTRSSSTCWATSPRPPRPTSSWSRTATSSPRSPTAPSCPASRGRARSEEHTSELQSRENLVCRLLLEKKKKSSPLSKVV